MGMKKGTEEKNESLFDSDVKHCDGMKEIILDLFYEILDIIINILTSHV